MTYRFQTLDGLRGLCALAVLEFHLMLAGGGSAFHHAYLAVDGFFVISGVVLASAYDAKFAAGLSAGDFLRRRLRRLAPILWAGLLVCIVGFLAARLVRHEGLDISQMLALLWLTIQNVFLVPLVSHRPVEAFPLNGVSWSLFAELVVNIGFAFFWRRLDNRVLWGLVLGGYAVTALLTAINGSGDFGALQKNVLFAVPRALPSFAAGILLFRRWQMDGLRRLPSVPAWLLLALAFVTLAALPAHTPVLLDMALTGLGWPLLIGLLMRRGGSIPNGLRALGTLSYPLYASHSAVVSFVLATGLLGARGDLSLGVRALLTLAALMLAVAVHRAVQRLSGQVTDAPIGQGFGNMATADSHAAG